MNRRRRIDAKAVLDAAVRQFWRYGYVATSLSDLEAVTGLPRQSIYNRFGSKRAFFRQALAHYEEKMYAEVLQPMLAAHSPRAAVIGLFELAAATIADDGVRDGCLTVNTALELAPHDPEIKAHIDNAFAMLEDMFRDLVRQGQEAGEIDPGLKPDGTAQSLLGLFIGLRVLSRSRPDEALLQTIVDQAGGLLPPPMSIGIQD